MTYGWAILVVMAAIGALAYFGVLDTAGFLPERCNFPAGLDCIGEASVDVVNDQVLFVVQNNKGESINITAGTETGDDCAGTGTFLFDTGIGAGATSPTMTLANNEKGTVMITCTSIDEGRFKADIVLDYILASTGLPLSAAGNIRGKAS